MATLNEKFIKACQAEDFDTANLLLAEGMYFVYTCSLLDTERN